MMGYLPPGRDFVISLSLTGGDEAEEGSGYPIYESLEPRPAIDIILALPKVFLGYQGGGRTQPPSQPGCCMGRPVVPPTKLRAPQLLPLAEMRYRRGWPREKSTPSSWSSIPYGILVELMSLPHRQRISKAGRVGWMIGQC